MKIKYLLPLFIFIALGTFSSCDLFDKVDDVSFNVTLPLDFTINESADNQVANLILLRNCLTLPPMLK